MFQAGHIEVDTHDFLLQRSAIHGIFTPQDNSFPYRRWPMSAWVSSMMMLMPHLEAGVARGFAVRVPGFR